MRKLILFITVILGIYFVFLKKKPVQIPKQNEIEEDANEVKKTDFSVALSNQPLTTDSAFSQNNKNQLEPPNRRNEATSSGSESSHGRDVDKQAIRKGFQELGHQATSEVESEIEKHTKKFAQIIPEYGDFEATPKTLTGNSSRIFSLFEPFDLIPDLEIKDIKSAFANGVYPSRNVIKILRLDDTFDGTIYIDYELKYKLVWTLRINSSSNPVRGIFSLLMNGIEKSCNAISFGPLKNISLLSNDNGTILIKSCDESFYMQLYRHSGNSLSGIYYERDENGNYKSFKDHNLSFYRRTKNE